MVVADTNSVDQQSELVVLTDLLDKQVAPQQSSLLPALSHAIDGGHIRAHLQRLLDIIESGPVTVTGYVHPNGFLKIRLCGREGRWTLRLHVWNRPGAEAQIHSHQWNFASRLLSGCMRTFLYEALDDPSGDHVRLRCRRPSGHGYEFGMIGRCRLVAQQEMEYQPGDSYLQDHRWLHTLETSGSAPLVTVVLQGHDVSTWSTVIVAGGEEVPRRVPIRALERAEIKEVLTLASTLLPG